MTQSNPRLGQYFRPTLRDNRSTSAVSALIIFIFFGIIETMSRKTFDHRTQSFNYVECLLGKTKSKQIIMRQTIHMQQSERKLSNQLPLPQ